MWLPEGMFLKCPCSIITPLLKTHERLHVTHRTSQDNAQASRHSPQCPPPPASISEAHTPYLTPETPASHQSPAYFWLFLTFASAQALPMAQNAFPLLFILQDSAQVALPPGSLPCPTQAGLGICPLPSKMPTASAPITAVYPNVS